MNNQTLLGLMLLLLLLMGCHVAPSSSSQSDAIDVAAEIDPEPMILVYTMDGRPIETSQQANRVIEHALDKPLSISRDNLKLAELIEMVRVGTGLNLVVNWQALELVGIDQDSLVTIQVKDTAARTLLKLVLEQVGADAFDDDKAGLAIRDSVVKISTLRDLKQGVTTRVYDVSWFANSLFDTSRQLYTEHKQIGFLNGTVEATGEKIAIDAKDLKDWSFFCHGCRSVYHSDGEIDCVMLQEQIDTLAELIMSSIGHKDEWLDEASSLQTMDYRFVISTTRENHEQIFALLRSLRKAQINAFESKAREIEVVTLLRQAEQYRLKQSYRAALRLIDQALRVDPNHAEARVLRKIVVGAMN